MHRESAVGRRSGPARHERPDVDDAALRAARAADHVLDAAEASGSRRWSEYFAGIPDRLRDDDLRDLRATAQRARAAYGPKDSIRETLPAEVTEPLLEAIDRLLKAMARRDAAGG